MQETALVSGDLGPVDFAAFARLAAICFSEVIWFAPGLDCDSGLPRVGYRVGDDWGLSGLFLSNNSLEIAVTDEGHGCG
jgi:hypothetical protein